MKVYPINEQELRHFLEMEFIFEVMFGEGLDLFDADRQIKQALKTEGFASFDDYIDNQMKQRHPMEV